MEGGGLNAFDFFLVGGGGLIFRGMYPVNADGCPPVLSRRLQNGFRERGVVYYRIFFLDRMTAFLDDSLRLNPNDHCFLHYFFSVEIVRASQVRGTCAGRLCLFMELWTYLYSDCRRKKTPLAVTLNLSLIYLVL